MGTGWKREKEVVGKTGMECAVRLMQAWVQISTPLLARWVTLGKHLALSELQFSPLL